MPNIGVPELLVIFMILLLVFGGSRLPQIGEAVGKTMRSFKRGMASDDAIQVSGGDKRSTEKREAREGREDPSDAELIDKS